MMNTIKVAVGSKNPVKINAVKEAFTNYFDEPIIYSEEVESGVSVQPFDEETFNGAKNRVNNLITSGNELINSCDFFVGIEGGVINYYQKWFGLGVICISDKNKKYSFGTSSLFPLPDIVIEKLKSGMELGNVIDEIQNEFNTKQKHGAVGFLTKGILSRKDLYIPGLISALIPFNNKKMF